MPRRPILRSLFASALTLVVCIGVAIPQAHGEEKAKKKSEHSTKSEGSKSEHSTKSEGSKSKRKKKKEKGEKIAAENVIGGSSRVTPKQFDDEAAQAGKVDAVIVLDASRSMQRTDPRRLRDQAAKLFLRFLSEGDRIAITQFDREAKQILPMTEVTPASLPNLDKTIAAIPMEGGFTDLEAALEEALTQLAHEGRPDATKAVILLSDGKMDPHPSRGSPEEMTKKVLEADLPQYVEKNIRLYTVAMSEEADKELLESFAKAGGGLSWYAPDATTIHKRFSELFLTLKRPQVVPLDGEGFEVDSSVQEATFYINLKDAKEGVTLVDPRGTAMSSENIPPGVKWFSGELFDVVTISRPFPGKWTVKGLESAEGFATLLSDIKLQIRWPESSFKLGDTVAVFARLTNSGEEVQKPGLDEITFYTYKIVSSDTGATWLNGALNDKGENGDQKAGDGIFSTTLKLDKDGEFQGLFAVTSPTFTRQQRISFSVSTGLVSLRVIPPDDFAGTPETMQAVLSKDPSEFKQLKVQLVAKKEGTDKSVGITLKSEKDGASVFPIPLEKLEPGDYELLVRVVGSDERRKPVNASSETVKYHVAAKEGAEPVEGLTEVIEDEQPEEGEPTETGHGDVLIGLVGLVLAIAWVGGLAFLGLKKVSGKKVQINERKPYVVPDEIAQRLQQLKSGASDSKRKATADDREIFRRVNDIFGAPSEPHEGSQESTPS